MRTIFYVTGMVLMCAITYAQTPTFEVASVKPVPPPDGRRIMVRATGVPGSPHGKNPGRFTAENFSLTNLITMAYDIPHYRLSAPSGLNMAMFHIEAKMPGETTKEHFP